MTGGDARYQPGAHYFATRLHDLDFAMVGSLDAAPGDVELVDHPRGTGRVSYRRLVVRGGRLRGALMVGERELAVRRRGRLYKRLVDLGADVDGIARSLLDPGFDLHGFIEQRAMVARPAATVARDRPAEMRGTQRIALPRAASAVPVAEPLGTVAASPMLSIGLRLPAAAAPPLEETVASAHLEWAGRRVALAREVVSLGRHASATLELDDVAISSRHAEIVCHEGARYLRDAGSRNGTWVNGDLVTTPHLLRDGDRIRLGAVELVFRGGEPGPAPAAPVKTLEDSEALPVLEILAGPGLGLSFALVGPEVTLGRDPGSGIRLDEPSVSRRHAVLAEHGGRWHVTDLHSSRGTQQNGARLAPGAEARLAEGDTLTLGDVVLVFTRRLRPVAAP